MEIKTVTYQRVLNLGNYESKRLEMTAQLESDEDFDAATSSLMQTVEAKIREDITQKIEEEIRALRRELRELKKEQLAATSPEKEAEDDGIPFDKDDLKRVDDLSGF